MVHFVKVYRSLILTVIVAFNALMQTVSKKDVFEMYVNDELVFSRMQMGRYPTANVHLKCTLDSVGDSSRSWM